MNHEAAHAQWQLSLGNDPGHPAGIHSKPATAAGPGCGAENASWGKKTVLLVDSDTRSRESRAKIMRTLGVTVDCAHSLRAARSRFQSGPYNLVLVDAGDDAEGAEALVQEIRSKKPRQLVAFLVGSPLFVSTSPKPMSTRARRVPPPAAPAVPVLKASASAASAADFGQRIKDAEAQQALDKPA